MADNEIRDVVIIGAGPGGLTAAMYAARAGMSVLVLDRMGPGGQASMTAEVENYPGFPEPVGGMDLAIKMSDQAERFAGPVKLAAVERVSRAEDGGFTVETSDGGIGCLSVIAAPGASWRKLGCKGEAEYAGRGVSYCAVCDGNFYRGMPVMVVGGGNSALDEAAFLARIASKVYIVHRRPVFRADKALQESCLALPNVECIMNTELEEIKGGDFVTGARLRQVVTGAEREIPVDAVFFFVGVAPNTGFLKGTVEMNEQGFIITDQQMATSVPGLFAAGDGRRTPLRQIVTACADGAIAAMSAYHYVQQLKGTVYPGYKAEAK